MVLTGKLFISEYIYIYIYTYQLNEMKISSKRLINQNTTDFSYQP